MIKYKLKINVTVAKVSVSGIPLLNVALKIISVKNSLGI